MVRNLNPADSHLASITKADKDFAKRHDFKDINFPGKTRDIQKTEKKIQFALAFLVMKIK